MQKKKVTRSQGHKVTSRKLKNYYCVVIFLSWCFLLPPQTVCLGQQATNQISQFGITWTFDQEYEYGQFANGDYWVVGPVTIISITPASVTSGGRIINGSMINPSPTSGRTQGYDSDMYGSYNQPGDYDPNLNAARPNNSILSASNPLIVAPGSSLVSTISTTGTEGRTRLQTAAILTVLNSPAAEGSFRPPYTNTSKTMRFNKNQLNYALLARLTPVADTPRLAEQAGDAQTESVERMFQRPWLDHVPNWLNRYNHPIENLPDYGREISAQVGIAALILNLNYTNQEKETLLIRLVQLGIDNYGIAQDSGQDNWVNNGGHNSGRKFPILFAGFMLNDQAMRNIGERSGDYLYYSGHGPGNEPADYIHFGEDDQTFYVTQLDVDITHSAQWDPDHRDDQRIPYEASDIGLAEWGIRHSNDPEVSNKYWDTAYRRCCTANAWGGFVLAAHIMDLKGLWNHDALFDFMDRYMQVTISAFPGWRQNTSVFVENMWDAYRNDYRPIWVMNNAFDPYSQGHLEGSGDIDYGDINDDNEITAYDASLAAHVAVGLNHPDIRNLAAADVSGDSQTTAFDAALIVQYAVGLIDRFPRE